MKRKLDIVDIVGCVVGVAMMGIGAWLAVKIFVEVAF